MDDIGGLRETIPTTMRLLLILEEVAAAGVPVTPTAVNERLGLPKPTIHRLFSQLEAEGYVQREIDGRSYTAGTRLRRLAANVQSSSRVRTARLAILGALAEAVGETCNIALPDRQAMIYVDRVETKWPLRIQLPIGTKVPFHCTASGKLYLASLSQANFNGYLSSAALEPHTDRSIVDRGQLRDEIAATRSRGFGVDDEEFMDGMIALSRPIVDDHGRLMSTVSFHAPTVRLSLDDAHQHLDRLTEAAQELSRLALS